MDEITPEDSVVPVFLDTAANEPIVENPDPTLIYPDYESLHTSAMQKLMQGQPLTEEEARAVIGM